MKWLRVTVVVVSVVTTAATLSASVGAAVPRPADKVAETYVVTTLADALPASNPPAHHCEDAHNAHQCSLRAAFAAVNADFVSSPGSWDEVKLPAGDVDLNPSTSANPLNLTSSGDLSVVGAGPTSSVINGVVHSFGASLLVVSGPTDTVSLSGVGFTGGAAGQGSGVDDVSEGGLSVRDCAFTDDSTPGAGGAIFVGPASAVTISSSTFSHDHAATDGGAVTDSGRGSLSLSDDTFSHDTVTGIDSSYDGGAVQSTGSASITRSTFDDDSAPGSGGAVDVDGALVASGNSFTGDSAGTFGGAVNALSDAQVSTSAFKSDSAGSGGGALAVDQIATLATDTFASDSTGGLGGDLFIPRCVGQNPRLTRSRM